MDAKLLHEFLASGSLFLAPKRGHYTEREMAKVMGIILSALSLAAAVEGPPDSTPETDGKAMLSLTYPRPILAFQRVGVSMTPLNILPGLWHEDDAWRSGSRCRKGQPLSVVVPIQEEGGVTRGEEPTRFHGLPLIEASQIPQ